MESRLVSGPALLRNFTPSLLSLLVCSPLSAGLSQTADFDLVEQVALPRPASKAAPGDFIGGGGVGFAIPDADPAGSSSSIVVNLAPAEIITGVNVSLNGLAHTWVGDLSATLTGPGGSIDLMFRPGQIGGAGFGDSADLDGDYTFADGGADFLAATGTTPGGSVVPVGTYAPTTANGAPTSFAGVFGGSTTNGIWTMAISDNAAGDLGSIDSWTLNITSVPEPSSFLAVGLVAISCAGVKCWRRKRAI